MLLSAFDPALMIYQYADWRASEEHCLRRFSALALHRKMTREYGQKVAMSHGLASLILQYFPWSNGYRGISELRDLRHFILEELQKAHYLDPIAPSEADLQPSGIVCQCVDAPEVANSWRELLCACVDEALSGQFDPQIATWETDRLRESGGLLTLRITYADTGGTSQALRLPLVWDHQSWAAQLAAQDWLPDLHRSVELCFQANPDMRCYQGVREEPLRFECAPAFSRSVDRYCQEDDALRHSLITALTKKVYGIRDAGLGDEEFGNVRRFRVTRDFRVHYVKEDEVLVLLEFGHHSIGRAR